MERAIRIRPPLRVRDSARAHTPAVGAAARATEPSRNGSAPADSGFRTRAFLRSCGARAPRRPGDGGRALSPRPGEGISENIDKFTGFFDK